MNQSSNDSWFNKSICLTAYQLFVGYLMLKVDSFVNGWLHDYNPN